MPRRRKRKPLTTEQILERRRVDRNHQAKKRYTLKQKKLFYIEYKKLCKKYGCFIDSLSGHFLTKQERGEEIYTIESHLDSIQRSIGD